MQHGTFEYWYWDTSRGQVGDKCQTSQRQVQKHCGPEHPEHTGTQVGDKCRIMRPGRQVRETSRKQMGNKRQTRDNWETSAETMRHKHPEPERRGLID